MQTESKFLSSEFPVLNKSAPTSPTLWREALANPRRLPNGSRQSTCNSTIGNQCSLTLPSLYYLCHSRCFTSFSFPPSVCMVNSHRACQPRVHHNFQHLGQLSELDPHSLLPPSTCICASSSAHNVPRWNYFVGFSLSVS